MATTFVRPAARSDAGAALEYVHGSEGERVAGIKSDLGMTQAEALAQVEGYLSGTTRKRAGLAGVHSFAVDELDPADPASPQRAVEITYDLLKRQYGKDSLGHVVAHLDSDSGLVHTHFFVPNHVLTSGKALRANWRIESLRKSNDQLMRELGGPFKVPTPAERSMTPAEFYTDVGDLAQAADLQVSELNYVTGREWIRTRMHELSQNPAVNSVEDLAQLAPEHGLSVQIRPATAKSGPVVTLAVIGADGEPVTCTDTGSKLAWAGKKLGKPFTYEGVSAEIQARLDRQAEQARAVEPAQSSPHIEAVPTATKERPAPSTQPERTQPKPVAQPEPVAAVAKPQVTQPERTQPKPVAAVAQPQVAKTPVDEHPFAWAAFNGKDWKGYQSWHERQPELVQVVPAEELHPAVAALPAETQGMLQANPNVSAKYVAFYDEWSARQTRQKLDPERTVRASREAVRGGVAQGDRVAEMLAEQARNRKRGGV